MKPIVNGLFPIQNTNRLKTKDFSIDLKGKDFSQSMGGYMTNINLSDIVSSYSKIINIFIISWGQLGTTTVSVFADFDCTKITVWCSAIPTSGTLGIRVVYE